MAKGIKEKNYDTTAGERMRNRRKRIKDSELTEKLVLMDEEDADKVKKYAEKLYKKRGKSLKP